MSHEIRSPRCAVLNEFDLLRNKYDLSVNLFDYVLANSQLLARLQRLLISLYSFLLSP